MKRLLAIALFGIMSSTNAAYWGAPAVSKQKCWSAEYGTYLDNCEAENRLRATLADDPLAEDMKRAREAEQEMDEKLRSGGTKLHRECQFTANLANWYATRGKHPRSVSKEFFEEYEKCTKLGLIQ